MNIVFISNFFNHHQKELCEQLKKCADGNFKFIQTKPMTDEREKLGWHVDNLPDYVVSSYIDKESEEECLSLINQADAVIIGGAPYQMIKQRLKDKKLVFVYSERIYKRKPKFYEMPLRRLKYYFKFGRHKSVYLLCASAYTASDYAKTGTFKGKAYKWGYFPKTKTYSDIEKLIDDKDSLSILWAGRFLDWKHPELAVKVAKRLKEQGYSFTMNLIGIGEIEQTIKEMIYKYELSDCVNMLGSMRQEEVRACMEKSEIFLFTSDRNEGWGAVLNEAMNSGCAVVCDNEIGSAPYLIEDGVNGLIYRSGSFEQLYNQVKYLLDNDIKRKEIGKKAYITLTEEWRASVASKRFFELVKCLEKGEKQTPYKTGLCSKA